LVGFGPIRTFLVGSGRIWTSLIGFALIRTCFGRIRSAQYLLIGSGRVKALLIGSTSCVIGRILDRPSLIGPGSGSLISKCLTEKINGVKNGSNTNFDSNGIKIARNYEILIGRRKLPYRVQVQSSAAQHLIQNDGNRCRIFGILYRCIQSLCNQEIYLAKCAFTSLATHLPSRG
jgi:hypothetical protein